MFCNSKAINEDATVLSDSECLCVCCDCCSNKFCLKFWRYLFRIFEVSSRILLISFIWITMGGALLAVIMFVDVLLLVLIVAFDVSASMPDENEFENQEKPSWLKECTKRYTRRGLFRFPILS